jgi:hypothetical protein
MNDPKMLSTEVGGGEGCYKLGYSPLLDNDKQGEESNRSGCRSKCVQPKSTYALIKASLQTKGNSVQHNSPNNTHEHITCSSLNSEIECAGMQFRVNHVPEL